MSRDNSWIFFSLIFFGMIIVFGGPLHLGFHGVIATPSLQTASPPNLLTILSWAWDGLSFIFGMLTFQVKDIPAWMIFMIFGVIGLMLLWIILKWVRGQNTGV